VPRLTRTGTSSAPKEPSRKHENTLGAIQVPTFDPFADLSPPKAPIAACLFPPNPATAPSPPQPPILHVDGDAAGSGGNLSAARDLYQAPQGRPANGRARRHPRLRLLSVSGYGPVVAAGIVGNTASRRAQQTLMQAGGGLIQGAGAGAHELRQACTASASIDAELQRPRKTNNACSNEGPHVLTSGQSRP